MDSIIKEVVTQAEQAQFRALLMEYVTALDVDLSFQNIKGELANLNEIYGRPSGRMYLAFDGEEAIGCIALRQIDIVAGGACEIRRMYVKTAYRGRGTGKALAGMVLQEARRIGYVAVFFDALTSMDEAHGLYGKLGFVEVPAYYYNPLQDIRYFCLKI